MVIFNNISTIVVMSIKNIVNNKTNQNFLGSFCMVYNPAVPYLSLRDLSKSIRTSTETAKINSNIRIDYLNKSTFPNNMIKIIDLKQIIECKECKIWEEYAENPSAFLSHMAAVDSKFAAQASDRINEIQELLKDDPDNIELLLEIPGHLVEFGPKYFGWQEKIFKKVLGIDPNISEAYSGLGSIYELTGNPAKAETCYRRAIALDPNDVSAINCLSHLLVKMNKTEKASELVLESIAKNDSLMARFRLADFYIKTDDLQEAFNQFQLIKERYEGGEIGTTKTQKMYFKGIYINSVLSIIEIHRGLENTAEAERIEKELESNPVYSKKDKLVYEVIDNYLNTL